MLSLDVRAPCYGVPMGRHGLSLSVVVVTYERPAFLERCLASLADEDEAIEQVVVVDASARSAQELVLRKLPTATYVHAPELAGHMTKSRNRALHHVVGDVISFIDDDVVVHRGWANAIRQAFNDEEMDALAGRTLNGIPGEDHPAEPIGTLTTDGRLTAGFGAVTDGRISVTHGIGANMSFTRQTLQRLGGFRDDYPGTALREDTDIFLRIARLGGSVLYDPAAAVDHLPAPHVHGRRFDTRYKLYGRRNHMVLLARHSGATSPLLRRWIVGQYEDVIKVSGARRRAERFGVTTLGVAWGALAVLRDAGVKPSPPERHDPGGQAVRASLGHGTS